MSGATENLPDGPTLWPVPDTTAPEIDERSHWNVIAGLLRERLGTDPDGTARVYDYGTVAGSFGNESGPDGIPDEDLPAVYVLLMIERRYVGPRRAGRAGRSGWRAAIRYVGRTVDEARWAQLWATEAIEEARLVVGDYLSTPVTLESANGISVDRGIYSGQSIWTYAL